MSGYKAGHDGRQQRAVVAQHLPLCARGGLQKPCARHFAAARRERAERAEDLRRGRAQNRGSACSITSPAIVQSTSFYLSIHNTIASADNNDLANSHGQRSQDELQERQ